jgi:hypothetical protein
LRFAPAEAKTPARTSSPEYEVCIAQGRVAPTLRGVGCASKLRRARTGSGRRGRLRDQVGLEGDRLRQVPEQGVGGSGDITRATFVPQ